MKTKTYSKPALKSPRFKKYENGDFFSVLRSRVDKHFKANNISYNGTKELHLKSLCILFIYCLLYGAIISNTFQPWGIIVLYGLLGIIKGLIGFNVIHDALHNAFSDSPLINRIIGYWFDFNGTSSHIWKLAHNVQHHTYTNIPGHDKDIDKGIFLRLNPSDKPYWFHRYQNWYALLLYSALCLNWIFYSDYAWFISEIKKGTVPRKEMLLFLSLKVSNLIFFLFLPIYLLTVPWWYVVLGYLNMLICAGILSSIVFQLAHIIDDVRYFEPDAEGNMECNWALHEMLTTSNFATNNRLLTAIVGGLNFQIEHHLFPHISHVHYKELQKVVKPTAEEFGIPYFEQPTLFSALYSHFRTLKRLGRMDCK